MPRRRSKASHPSVGGQRTDKQTVDSINDAQGMVQGAEEVFAKLEKDKANADAKAEAERGPRLSNFADLVFLGKMERIVEVAGWKFKMHSLTATEQRDLLAAILALPAESRLMYAKPYTIWMALDGINEAPLEVAASAAGFEDELEFVSSWQDSLIERLFAEYEKLSDESRSVFTEETIEDDLKK
jgi:hypothetical protein